MTELTTHFTLEEFTRSEVAIRNGRPLVADGLITANLRRLCTLVLEPLRAQVAQPVRILSGYRPPWLNIIVGGSATSEHVAGRAADIEVAGIDNATLAKIVLDLKLPFNQLILEFYPQGWVHVSVPKLGDEPKCEVLTAQKTGPRTVYLPGLRVVA
jgi:zinc D-Ala-D-Ala carboxypeptidase